jgi:hypothetical protein
MTTATAEAPAVEKQLFKIGTAHRMMLPYVTTQWYPSVKMAVAGPRLTETYWMARYTNPQKTLALKNDKQLKAYFTKIGKALKGEGFKTTKKELAEWFEDGYVIITQEPVAA